MPDEKNGAPAAGGTAGFTPEQMTQLNDLVSKAVGARVNRGSLSKQIEDAIKASLSGEALGKSVEAALEKMVADAPDDPDKKKPTAQTQPGNPAQPGNGNAGKDDPKYLALLEQLEEQRKQSDKDRQGLKDMQKALRLKDEEAVKAQTEAKAARIRTHVENELMPCVNNNRRLAKAIASAEVAAHVEELNGEFVWKRMNEGQEEMLPFADGFKAWVANEGKEVLPAPVRTLPSVSPFSLDPSLPGLRSQQSQQPPRNTIFGNMARDAASTPGGGDLAVALHNASLVGNGTSSK